MAIFVVPLGQLFQAHLTAAYSKETERAAMKSKIVFLIGVFEDLSANPATPFDLKSKYADKLIREIGSADPALRNELTGQISLVNQSIDGAIKYRAISLINRYKNSRSPAEISASSREILTFAVMRNFEDRPGRIMNEELVRAGYAHGISDIVAKPEEVIVCLDSNGDVIGPLVCAPASRFFGKEISKR